MVNPASLQAMLEATGVTMPVASSTTAIAANKLASNAPSPLLTTTPQQREPLLYHQQEQQLYYPLPPAEVNPPFNLVDYSISKRIRIERDYSKGNACQFSLEVPKALENKASGGATCVALHDTRVDSK